jgi:hypothetical protein
MNFHGHSNYIMTHAGAIVKGKERLDHEGAKKCVHWQF